MQSDPVGTPFASTRLFPSQSSQFIIDFTSPDAASAGNYPCSEFKSGLNLGRLDSSPDRLEFGDAPRIRFNGLSESDSASRI